MVESKMKTVISLFLLNLCFSKVLAEIITKPENTESVVGKTAQFICSTNNTAREIHWFHYPVGAVEKELVYGYNSFRGAYIGRFTLERNNFTGSVKLINRGVAEQDAGTYECQDDAGHGKIGQAELIVLESLPLCSSNLKRNEVAVGPNNCGVSVDFIQFSCNVNYLGKVPAVLEWRTGNETIVTDLKPTITANRVTYNLTVEATPSVDGQNYVCQTTRATDRQFSCSSDTIEVWGTSNEFSVVQKKVGETVECKADNGPWSCGYKWTKQETDGNEVLVSKDQMIKPNASGLYKCQVDCTVKTKPCSVFPMLVQVTSTDPPGDGQNLVNGSEKVEESKSYKSAFIAAVLLLIIVVIGFLLLFFCFVRRKQRTKKNKQEYRKLIQENKDDMEKKLSEEKAKKEKITTRVEELEQQLLKAQSHWAKEKDRLTKRAQDAKTETRSVEYIDNPILLRTIKTKAAESRQDAQVKGLVQLNNEIFIISKMESEIEVYDATSFQHLRPLKVDDLVHPDDATSCVRNRCLYIIDVKEQAKEILRIDSNGTIIAKWPVGNENALLSVTNETNVILTAYQSSTLIEYSPTGILIQKIELFKAGVNHPMHSIKLKSGNFIVVQGCGKDAVHRVCEVDVATNRVIKSFGEGSGSTKGQLSSPTYLALDRDGSIMIADATNARIVLLGSNFEFKREIVSEKDGILMPTRIILDELNGRLQIGDYKKKCVLVYSVI